MANFIWQNKQDPTRFQSVDVPENCRMPGVPDGLAAGWYICAFHTQKQASDALKMAQQRDTSYNQWQVREMVPGSWPKFREQLRASGVKGLMVIDPNTEKITFTPLDQLQ